jgi:hypothetical protein
MSIDPLKLHTAAIEWISNIHNDSPDGDDALSIIRAIRRLSDQDVVSILEKLDRGLDASAIASATSWPEGSAIKAITQANDKRAVQVVHVIKQNP